MQPKTEREIRFFFRISVLLKGISSFLEIVAGVLAAFVPLSFLTNVLLAMANGELREDPHDLIATSVLALVHGFALPSQAFIALYLISRGAIKLALVVALLCEKLWAYPASLIVLGAFVLYQIYQIALSHSITLIALSLFDLLVMYFIWMEYRILKEHLRAAPPSTS